MLIDIQSYKPKLLVDTAKAPEEMEMDAPSAEPEPQSPPARLNDAMT